MRQVYQVLSCWLIACNAYALDGELIGTFTGQDLQRPQIPIKLIPVVSGVTQPTDLQFLPDLKNALVVLEKTGRAKLFYLKPDVVVTDHKVILEVAVESDSELGLLGLAFHPDFSKNRQFVINYTPKAAGRLFSRIAKWQLSKDLNAQNEQIIFEVEQPYRNHNAGQLAFGADKYLYIGLGDGGSGGDPQDYAQNMQSYLGKMLRIDIDQPSGAKPYSIPTDNPFVNDTAALPEIWALGLRNPWRYSFDNQQRLIVADVGQGKWEEIDIVAKGFNMGWNRKEASHCYPPDSWCLSGDMIDPIYEYDREDGVSVTGGYVYNGANSKLQGKYIFGDFGKGRIWALDLPAKYQPNKSIAEVYSLGQFEMNISTFGRDAAGEVYLADFFNGIIYKIVIIE